MTKDDIIKLAQKAGMPMAWISDSGVLKWTDLERFAKLVAAAEREWVGLTDEDVNRESTPITSQMKLAFHAGMYVAQKILKERNT